MAQLGARFHGMEEVEGSNPSRSTTQDPEIKDLQDENRGAIKSAVSPENGENQALQSPSESMDCPIPGHGRRILGVILDLTGHVPSKKNLWRPKPGGGVRLDSSARCAISALVTQAAYSWRSLGRTPLEHPNLTVRFYVANKRGDRDNKLSCLLDVLQEAGVIRNDNIAHFNGTITLLPAIVAKEEKVTIEIT